MSEQKSFLGRLFGLLWNVVVVIYRVAFVVSLVVLGVLAWMAFQGGPPPRVESNVALVLAPTGALVEQADRDPGQELFENLSGEAPAQSTLRDLIEALHAAASDSRIAFAVLKLDAMEDAGLPQLEEFNDGIREFQASGKKVIAYGPWYDQAHYYSAAQADEVVLDPLGIVYMEGFSSYQNYFKEALDKLGVQVHVFRVGEYKSAVEPFTRNDMSEEARKANLDWLGDLWQQYDAAIDAGRKLPAGTVDSYVRNFMPALEANHGDTAGYAKEAGLVTHLEKLAEFRHRMAAIVGTDDNHGSFRQVHYREYLRAVRHELGLNKIAAKKGKVGLIVVQGEIVDGPGDVGQAGGDTISDLLDQARRDDEVSAVVLRVDSPGGSVWASEQIRRAVQQLKADGKPVVASMSTVAASGGYWVAMDADQIWAHASTITGSIGIFGLVPTLEQSLAKLGIHTDGVGTTPLAGAFRLDRALSPEVAHIVQSQIDKGYRDFISGVAEARSLSVEKVDSIARGRVWSGVDAKELGLVDELGSLQQAADAAAVLAGLQPGGYKLEDFQPERDFTSRLIARFSGSAALGSLPAGAAAWLRELLAKSDIERVLRTLNDPQGMYAHCYCTPSMGGRHGGH
ncbi:MAG TPA: signal peptide peptidase SppA [Solimonas sp.]|nr:signal peptide peptidase SppA [Solimonas sp.]